MLCFYRVTRPGEGQDPGRWSCPLPAPGASIKALITGIKGTHLNVSGEEKTCSLQETTLKVREVLNLT